MRTCWTQESERADVTHVWHRRSNSFETTKQAENETSFLMAVCLWAWKIQKIEIEQIEPRVRYCAYLIPSRFHDLSNGTFPDIGNPDEDP